MEWYSLKSQFLPHGHCYLWRPEILWLHVISDCIIAISYFSIPLILTYIVYRSRDSISFNVFFLLFAIFILACGTTHLMEIINVWKTEYLLAGIVKAITALASLGTALVLIPNISKIVDAIRAQND